MNVSTLGRAIEESRAVRTYRLFQHTKLARRALRSIEGENGKTPAALKRLSKEYARDVLGSVTHAPWLYVFSALSRDFKEGWIPDTYYANEVIPRIKGRYLEATSLSSMTNRLALDLPFADVAYKVNGVITKCNGEVVQRENLDDVLFERSAVVVFKADGGAAGRDIAFIRRGSFDAERLHELPDGVFQYRISQHESFSTFGSSAVATLRITTAMDENGAVSVRGAYLRIGRASDSCVRSQTHIRIPVNPLTGFCGPTAFMPNWQTTAAHPDTGVPFDEMVVPSYGPCVDVVLRGQKLIPYSGCIGWDVAIDTDANPVIMEWNGRHNDIRFSEATQGPCFSNLGWEKFWKTK